MVDKPKNMLIGEMLLEEGIITKEQLKDALEEQKKTGEKIGQILIKMGYISKEILWTFLGYQMGVPYINLEEISEIRQDVLKLLPEQLMRNEKLIPISKQGKVITVAMADPLNFLVVDDLKATTRCEIDVRLAPPEDIKKLVDKYFGYKEEDTGEIAKAKVDELDDILSAPIGPSQPKKEDTGIKIVRSPFAYDASGEGVAKEQIKKEKKVQPERDEEVKPVSIPEPEKFTKKEPVSVQQPNEHQGYLNDENVQSVAGDTPVNTFLTALLSEAYESAATDIHIEPFSDRCRIRRRIDGVLYEVESPPRTLYNGILNKIKELAQLNINEKNVPQESKFKLRVLGKEINLSVNTFPTIFGEKIVLKIVRAENVIFSLDELGMEENELEIYSKILKMPHGLVLISGPTNSGKTVTVYSTLSALNRAEVNIFSIDDATSNYILPGINQAKVSRKNYARVLNYLMEQDCDIISVGDIGDKETAEAIFDMIAGGHLVIAKIRANDNFQAMQSIINFGIEPYLVYSNTLVVLNQRLLRKICPKCKVPIEITDDIMRILGETSVRNLILYKGRGCDDCSGTGYKGRTAIFEMLLINESIKDMLLNKEQAKKIREENCKLNNFKTLKEAALLKVVQGITTIDEFVKIN